jgi:hypothetical protein
MGAPPPWAFAPFLGSPLSSFSSPQRHSLDSPTASLEAAHELVKDRGAQERASRTSPEALVGRWVFVQVLQPDNKFS